MSEILLDVKNLKCYFKDNKSVVKAVDDISFQIKKGEIFGLVGESGSGKSTTAKCIMNIIKPASGKIFYNGIDTMNKKEYNKNKKMLRSKRQIIFQDSLSSLDGKMKVSEIISEPMKIHKLKSEKDAKWWLEYVGLDKAYLAYYPSELSGGMRQRVSVARALSMSPELLVADEPVASLDVSVQAQIINLFKELKEKQGFSVLFIAHDLSVVKYLCDKVAVMHKGKIVEIGTTEEIFASPKHPYTKELLSSIPVPDCYLNKEEK